MKKNVQSQSINMQILLRINVVKVMPPHSYVLIDESSHGGGE